MFQIYYKCAGFGYGKAQHQELPLNQASRKLAWSLKTE